MLTNSDIRGIKYLLANASSLKDEDGNVKTLADIVLEIRNDLNALATGGAGGEGGEGGEGGGGGAGGAGGAVSVNVQLGELTTLMSEMIGLQTATLNAQTAIMVALCEPGDGRECAAQILKEVCETPLSITETTRSVPDTITQRRAVIESKQEDAQALAKNVAAEKLAAVKADRVVKAPTATGTGVSTGTSTTVRR